MDEQGAGEVRGAEGETRAPDHTRLFGHLVLLAIGFVGIFHAYRSADLGPRFGFEVLVLFTFGFPIVIGWIAGVIALEVALRRGEGSRAIRFALSVGAATMLLLLAILYYLMHVTLRVI